MERERSCRWSRLPGGRHRTQKPVSPGSYALPGVATCRESRRLPGVPEWGTLPRLSLSTEFFLPFRTGARFPGRVSRSTGHASSIRTSLNRTRDKVDEPACFLWRLHELPDGAGSVVHISPRTRNADPKTRIGAQSALAAQAPPRSSAMRNSCLRGHPSDDCGLRNVD